MSEDGATSVQEELMLETASMQSVTIQTASASLTLIIEDGSPSPTAMRDGGRERRGDGRCLLHCTQDATSKEMVETKVRRRVEGCMFSASRLVSVCSCLSGCVFLCASVGLRVSG